ALRRLDTHLADLRHEAEHVLEMLDETAGDIEGVVSEALTRRPYAVLSAAAALGYVLGGGLPTSAVRFALAFGTRLGVELLARRLSVHLAATPERVQMTTP